MSLYSIRKPAFTLVEMLIVIVIIGILAAALIPRLTGIQARARDTARNVDLRNIATAIETYKVDNGSYPTPNYIFAAVPRQVALQELFIPSAFAQTLGSSLDTLTGSLSSYLKSLPRDPNGKGVKSIQGANGCIEEGSSYAYASSGNWYSITAKSEAGKGNASSCGDTIDRADDGGYKKEGQGLKIDIQLASAGGGSYPDSSQWTDAEQFTFSDGVISAYNGPNGIGVIIPATIGGVAVTSIGHSTFENNQLTSVTIPNSVTSIGSEAFGQNNLTSIIIPNSVTNIGGGAFAQNRLTSVVIPNSVTTIERSAFEFNQLTSITIPNSVDTIGAYAFSDNRLTSVNIPNSVDTIGGGVFSKNRLTSVTIPNSVTSIGERAFYDNSLTSVTIPNSVTSIGERAFGSNRLTSVVIPDSVTSIGPGAFEQNGPNLSSIDTIPRTPIAAARGTRNLVGTTWVKQ